MVAFASMRPMHDVSVIETPENVEIVLRLAGIGSRFLAYLVDLAWQSVAVLPALVIVMVSFAATRIPFDKNPDGTLAIPWVAVAVLDAVVLASTSFTLPLSKLFGAVKRLASAYATCA